MYVPLYHEYRVSMYTMYLPPELALLTVPNIREYFYTNIRFSTPTLSTLLGLAGQICLS
jgi:hypothetical protein